MLQGWCASLNQQSRPAKDPKRSASHCEDFPPDLQFQRTRQPLDINSPNNSPTMASAAIKRPSRSTRRALHTTNMLASASNHNAASRGGAVGAGRSNRPLWRWHLPELNAQTLLFVYHDLSRTSAGAARRVGWRMGWMASAALRR